MLQPSVNVRHGRHTKQTAYVLEELVTETGTDGLTGVGSRQQRSVERLRGRVTRHAVLQGDHVVAVRVVVHPLCHQLQPRRSHRLRRVVAGRRR